MNRFAGTVAPAAGSYTTGRELSTSARWNRPEEMRQHCRGVGDRPEMNAIARAVMVLGLVTSAPGSYWAFQFASAPVHP